MPRLARPARRSATPDGWAGLVAVVVLLVATPAAAALRLFVANSGDDTVSVVDGALDREVATIAVGRMPQGLALRAAPPLLAVANSGDASVTFVDPEGLGTLGEAVRVGRFPLDLEFSADGRTLWCTSYDDRTVTPVDVAARTAGTPIAVPGVPKRLQRSPDGRRLFVLLYEEAGTVAVLDLAAAHLETTVSVGSYPTDFVLTPDGRRLLVASFSDDRLTAIDAATLAVEETRPFRVGNGLLVHPARPLLYSILTFDDAVAVYDLAARREVAEVAVGQEPVYSTLSPDGAFVWVVNGTDGNVMKVDTATNTVAVRIAVGVEPVEIVAWDVPEARWGVRTAVLATGLAGLLAAALLARRRRPR